MRKTDPRVEEFFAETGKWRAELAALRAILLASPLEEDFKWGNPCYTYGKGNVATVWGLKDGAAIAFFKGALLKDPEAILAAPGENSRSMRTIRVAGLDEVEALKTAIEDYLREAVEIEKAGLKVDFAKDDLAYPDELAAKLDADPAFKAAFEALTPGRRRGYVLHFSQAKQPATRQSRIEKAAPRILEGEGMQDR